MPCPPLSKQSFGVFTQTGIKTKLKIEREERGKYEYITRRVNHGISTTILLTPI